MGGWLGCNTLVRGLGHSFSLKIALNLASADLPPLSCLHPISLAISSTNSIIAAYSNPQHHNFFNPQHHNFFPSSTALHRQPSSTMLRRPITITDSSPKKYDKDDVQLQHAKSARKNYLHSIILGASLVGLGYFLGSRPVPIHDVVAPKQASANLITTKDNASGNISTYASVIEANFGASVKMPDSQLLQHLNSNTIQNRKRHAPNRTELLESLYGIKGETRSFYDGFSFPSDRARRYPISKYVSNFFRWVLYNNMFTNIIDKLLMFFCRKKKNEGITKMYLIWLKN